MNTKPLKLVAVVVWSLAIICWIGLGVGCAVREDRQQDRPDDPPATRATKDDPATYDENTPLPKLQARWLALGKEMRDLPPAPPPPPPGTDIEKANEQVRQANERTRQYNALVKERNRIWGLIEAKMGEEKAKEWARRELWGKP